MTNQRTVCAAILGVVLSITLVLVCVGNSWYESVGLVQTLGMGGAAGGEVRYRAAAVRDGYIYTIYRGNMLAVFDAHDLDGANGVVILDRPIAEVELEPGNRDGLLVVGDRLYCYGWRGGLVFDISDAAGPLLTGMFGDDTTHIVHLAYCNGHLVAACHERVVVFSFLLSADYPTVVADLAMDTNTFVYEVCVIGDVLCMAGYYTRLSGKNEYWFGFWDFSVPEDAMLQFVMSTAERGYRLAALGDMLLAVSESDVALWRVTGEDVEFVETVSVCGRSMAVHGDRVILSGGGFSVRDGTLETLWADECSPDTALTGLPLLGAAGGDLVILPNLRSLAILQANERQ